MNNQIRLWTVQTAVAWRDFEKRGVLRADGRRICYRFFRPAYAWMVEQMRERGVETPRGKYPMWAWAGRKPSAAFIQELAVGQPAVVAELRVDASRVLISHFAAWHHVLNDFHLSLTDAEYKEFSAREDSEQTAVSIAQLDDEKRQSWKRIFDLATLETIDGWQVRGRQGHLQACIGEIRTEDVQIFRVIEPLRGATSNRK